MSTDSTAPASFTPPRRVGSTTGLVIAALVLLSACGDSDTADGEAASVVTSAITIEPTTTTAEATSSVPATAPDPEASATWELVDAGEPAPAGRSGAVLVAAPDGALWLHGGHINNEPLDDLWRFDGERWEEIVAPPGPTARSEHVGVWDADRERLVIALGQESGSDVFGDVWAFDPAAGAWSQLATEGPAARYGSCAVLDDAGRMVITHGFSSVQRFGDTWAFDLEAGSWTDITPAGGPRPSNRCLHACAYDDIAGELILFGGRNDLEPYLGDAWRLGAGGWEEIPGEGPSPRARSRGAFTTELLVLGGDGADGLPGDAWILRDGAWAPGPAGAPADREAPAMAEGDDVVWLFGGLGDSGSFADLWRYG